MRLRHRGAVAHCLLPGPPNELGVLAHELELVAVGQQQTEEVCRADPSSVSMSSSSRVAAT